MVARAAFAEDEASAWDRLPSTRISTSNGLTCYAAVEPLAKHYQNLYEQHFRTILDESQGREAVELIKEQVSIIVQAVRRSFTLVISSPAVLKCLISVALNRRERWSRYVSAPRPSRNLVHCSCLSSTDERRAHFISFCIGVAHFDVKPSCPSRACRGSSACQSRTTRKPH